MLESVLLAHQQQTAAQRTATGCSDSDFVRCDLTFARPSPQLQTGFVYVP